MKRIIIFALVMLFCLTGVTNGNAQTSDTVWLIASTTAYKTGETVLVSVNAASATPIQGFTFQIRYDPSCLRPVNASSPIPGMNGLPLPQLTGLVDGSYASTSPININGVLAEIRFTALKGCQTGLTLESAALAVRNVEGFAEPLSGVLIGERNISLIIDTEVNPSQPSQGEAGSILPLDPPKVDQNFPVWIVGVGLTILAFILIIGLLMLFRNGMIRSKSTSKQRSGMRRAALHIKHGPQAGTSFPLSRHPVLIGRDPQNDICINDPYVIGRHVQIFSERSGYYLRDLGGRTFLNGHPVKSNAVVLHQGDVVRLGKSVFLVFGYAVFE